MTDSDRLTTRDVARLLGVSVHTIHRIDARELPYTKLAGLRGPKLFNAVDVHAYLSAQKGGAA